MNQMLFVDQIHTFYDESHILQGLSLRVEASKGVALVGRNGMGKTTATHSIVGFVPVRRGRILYKGEDISRLPPYTRCKMGITLVPQGRRIFGSLTVKENISISCRTHRKPSGYNFEKIYTLFPALKTRSGNRGNQLSGGEQQMLAIARALVSNPDLMLMDEPSEGLAPMVIELVGETVRKLKQEGIAVMLAEQNLPLALGTCDYFYVINKGIVVFEGSGEELQRDELAKSEYLAL